MGRCHDVLVHGVQIHSRESNLRIPNDDGVDFTDCEHVRISDCHIETSDDCIVLFGSRGVTATNCFLRTRSTAIRVGYKGDAPTYGCTFSNLVIRDSNRGLGVFVRGGGDIEDVSFSNCQIQTRLFAGRWWGKGEPIHVSVMPYDPKAKRLGRVRGIRFDNIRALSPAGIVLWGHDASRLNDVAISHVDLRIVSDPLNDAYGGNLDLRLTRDISTNIFAHDLAALLARRVDDLHVHDFTVKWPGAPANHFKHAVDVEDYQRLTFDNLNGDAPVAGTSAVRTANERR